MLNQLLIDELQQSPYCDHCGSEFSTQADVAELIYLSSGTDFDWYLGTR